MKNQKISKKVLSIALSALIGVSAVPLSSLHAMFNGGGDKKEEPKITTQLNSSNSSSSSTIESLLKQLPDDWKLGNEESKQIEMQLLELVFQKWDDFWKAYHNIDHESAHDVTHNAAWDAAWDAAGSAAPNAAHKATPGTMDVDVWVATYYAAIVAAWKQGGAASEAIVEATKEKRTIELNDGTKILIGSREYFKNLIKVLDDQTNILRSLVSANSSSSSSSSSSQ